MKNFPFLLTITLLLTAGQGLCQTDESRSYPLKALSPIELVRLSMLPEVSLTAPMRNRDLPSAVDNSQHIYLRPVFNQDGYSCGQAAGIAYNYTYEIDRARNIPADQLQNQYPTHFAWNFMNGGNGWYGVSYLHSFEIIKYCGMPNAVDYGGSLSYGGPVRWMSGYSEYYNGMHNRINGVYQINCADEDGLMTLKGWLYDHLDSSSVGGVASYYAQYTGASNTLPAGTPEAGSYVITNYGGSPNHAMTIVGYNDSIRWDYNNDGQYTNHLDINSDGNVDMKDWEIGGLRMVQSYGGVPNWGDTGFAYMMYKTLADDLGSGGIWNHAVHILEVKPEYEPLLTARIVLTHDKRDCIKVIAGFSGNPSATEPEYRLDFPIFDYQGGDNYMQGGATEADKTIEFGLDLSPLLTNIELNQNTKFFLEVVEKDPSNQATGEVNQFSIYDHTGAVIEIISPMVNVPLTDNDTTSLTLNHTLNFNRVEIADEFLPPIPINQPFNQQMNVSGGTPPYSWQFDKTYSESGTYSSYPAISAIQLTPSNNSDGMVTRELDFEFPYFDSSYSSVTMHVDGYLMFDEQLYPYPYFNDDKVLFSITRNISPFMTQDQQINPSASQGLWYEGDTTSATFRWKTALSSNTTITFDYVVKLYATGKIEFFYGDMGSMSGITWISGISDGDDVNFQQTAVSNKPVVANNLKISLNRYEYPDELQISEEGIISGLIQQNYNGVQLPVTVTDNIFIHNTKVFTLSSNGLVIQDSISAGGDDIIEFGETVLMSVLVTNINDADIPDAEMSISIEDEYITLGDSTEFLGTLASGTTLRFIDAFAYEVAPSVPNDHIFNIQTHISGQDTTWEGNLFHTAYAPIIQISGVFVDDENERLDPGDSSNVVVTFQNAGGTAAHNIITLLDEDDEFVGIQNGYAGFVVLEPGHTAEGNYPVTVSEEALNGHTVDFTVDLSADNAYSVIDSFSLVIGFNQERFETGDFSQAGWGFMGSRGWQVDTYAPYEGVYSARSGFITHEEQSSMIIDMEVLEDGEISFYKRVSCEDDEGAGNNYDYLAFYIDGIEQDRWDGFSDWSLQTYPVEQGDHRFEWRYRKDLSVSAGMDGAWIDMITFPSAEDRCPSMVIQPDALESLLRPGETDTDTLMLTNTGFDELGFELQISAIGPGNSAAGGRSILGSYINSSAEYLYQEEPVTVTFTIYNASPDNEWIKDIYLEFPSGMELTTTTDFVGGSAGDLIFQGDLGNGATANWHGEENNWGVLKGGETATADLTILLHGPAVSDINLHYEVHGDIYGAQPHVIQGEIEFINLGEKLTWLETNTGSGIIPSASTNSILVNINTEGLGNGNYDGWLIIDHYFENRVFIPVNLMVDPTISINDHTEQSNSENVQIHPNPTPGILTLEINLEANSPVVISVFDPAGRQYGNYSTGMLAPGKQQVILNTRHNFGLSRNGVYYMKVKTGQSSFIKKFILHSGN